MKIQKAAAIPLITHDPYFSIWSGADHLYDTDPIHWSGLPQEVRGCVRVGNSTYAFLGCPDGLPVIPQTGLEVTAMTSSYTFENKDLKLSVHFTSPVMASDPVLLSRPCTYIDILCEPSGTEQACVRVTLGRNLVSSDDSPLVGTVSRTGRFAYAMMGRAFQKPLGVSGDNLLNDAGYVYLASSDGDARFCFNQEAGRIGVEETASEIHLVAAYDDLVSINYFGQFRRAYWTRTYETILDAIGAAMEDRVHVTWKAAELDRRIERLAIEAGGEDYAFLCVMSYRQVMAAHKLICDENGDLVFLSKENDSNGCIGTVDVSYPSTPLLLLENPELVKGLIRPVMRFARCHVWPFDYAPHDVGRYPYAWGQVYGLDQKGCSSVINGQQGAIYAPFFEFPAGMKLYDGHHQMPVEESGNMLIMTAAVCLAEGSGAFARPYMPLFAAWSKYLEEYGEDPGEQLCTDDFAGHLAHNVNLSVKAVMGVEAYAILLRLNGQTGESASYHEKATSMAKSLENRAFAGDHYSLVYSEKGVPAAEDPAVRDTWSLKYNLVWDRVFQSHLFSDAIFETETAFYLNKLQPYGVPLDSRRLYTKSDWELWASALTSSREAREKLIAPVARFLTETPDRYPFSDWYNTDSGTFCHFKGRSVQGGIFMPVLADRLAAAADRHQ